MFKKRHLLAILILLYLICPLGAGITVFAQESDDPAAQLSSGTEAAPAESEVTPYTADEFDQLPDDQKKDVYLNSPELLPLNFDPNQYSEVLYSQQ
jgi:hypothetical protein